MFYRVSTNSIGSGLGLYIVKETVDKLQGAIELRSEPGKGSEFSIHLPNLPKGREVPIGRRN
jgi:signal transduction histidine kinase